MYRNSNTWKIRVLESLERVRMLTLRKQSSVICRRHPSYWNCSAAHAYSPTGLAWEYGAVGKLRLPGLLRQACCQTCGNSAGIPATDGSRWLWWHCSDLPPIPDPLATPTPADMIPSMNKYHTFSINHSSSCKHDTHTR